MLDSNSCQDANAEQKRK